ncbi:quinol:cytochrome C oxidoreductase [Capnocytophaga sp. G2]|jgi:hypothetical protein|uniref:quinol:cytochrome C oxidoreductase n=1 Tax=Capnocytophaga sp. G2 TaxID=3110695 RepID=UPI002B45C532|nr:quinol:cytochrome C oxidoreductase [Capnocytophaga sp. G2]MEB3004632.1 quinol:cytochrome C oxidoreductase [Capnocytophaga sp. G2]
MYSFSGKIKLVAILSMVVGLLGIGYSFIAVPSTVEALGVPAGGDAAHAEHVLQLLKNKPWAALYVAALFFMLISLGVLAFYAINRAAQAGWAPILFRVMEGITGYLPVGALIFFVLLVLSGLHLNHLFIWMDPQVVAHDTVIQGKTAYLNVPFFLIRTAIYLLGWIGYRQITRRLSKAQDQASDNRPFVKAFKWSAGFLVFFLVTESMMSWDWIMGLDPHWFSTLFGWYVFSSFITASIAALILVTITLKGQGYLEHVNDSHLHDLAKYLFGFSIFWAYLWFSQYMLYWYSNIPEEVTYFITRLNDFEPVVLGMLAINFLLPLLILVDSDIKRKPWVIGIMSVVILAGHYLDFYNMIMPATVGDQWSIGIGEIGSVVFFFGLFTYVTFLTLTKVPLIEKRHPLMGESEHFHY